jgi:hypothetical protein
MNFDNAWFEASVLERLLQRSEKIMGARADIVSNVDPALEEFCSFLQSDLTAIPRYGRSAQREARLVCQNPHL